MSARRRLVVVALLALPLVSAPFGLAAGKVDRGDIRLRGAGV